MESRTLEHTRTTMEDQSTNEDSDCFRDSYATAVPFRRPYNLNVRKENLLYKFEEEYETNKPELIQIYLRLKPSDTTNVAYEVRSNKCLVTSMDMAMSTMSHTRSTQQIVKKLYTFSHIFGSDSHQKEIFEIVVKANLQRLSEGHNYTLLTYGASGSGKTYTLMGTKTAPGLIPRSLEYLFHIVEASQSPCYRPCDNGAEKLSTIQKYQELMWVEKLRQVSAPARKKYRRMSANLTGDFSASTLNLSNRNRYYIWVSFIEIYNEVVYDLLAPPDTRTKLYIMSDSNGQEYVKGAKQAFVRSGEEAYDVLVAGRHNLRVASTGVNAQSSRSHCIFMITMITESVDGVRISRMRLCDLAGSERANRTQNKGARMAESGAINSSLHVLERCLRTLRKNQQQRKPDSGFVPYRQSKLTRLLCSGLSGSCGEAFGLVVTLSQELDCVPESKRVLQVTAIAKDIQINNTVSESTLESTGSLVDDAYGLSKDERLCSDCERLHFELAQRENEIKELRALLEKGKQESNELMQFLVKEAKDMTHEYYTGLMDNLKQRHTEEIDSMKQRNAEEVNQLMSEKTHSLTEIAKLQEQLAAEKLARTIDLEELQYLRGVLEEAEQDKYSGRATSKLKNYDPMLSDTDHDESDDSFESHETDENAALHDVPKENVHQSKNYEIEDAITQISTDSVSLVSDNVANITVDSDDDIANDEYKTEHVNSNIACDIINVACSKDDKNESNSDRDEKSALPITTCANRLSKQTFSEQEKMNVSPVLPSKISTMISSDVDKNLLPKLLQPKFEDLTIVKAAKDISEDSYSVPLIHSEESLKSTEMENERTIKNADCFLKKTKEDRNGNANSAKTNIDSHEVLDQSRQAKVTNNSYQRSMSQSKDELNVDIAMELNSFKPEDVIENVDLKVCSGEKQEIQNFNSITFDKYAEELLASSAKAVCTKKGSDGSLSKDRPTRLPKITTNTDIVELGKSNESPMHCTILNSSLAQFERFESAISDRKFRENAGNITIDFEEPHASKEKKIYFDNLDVSISDTDPKLKLKSEVDITEKSCARNNSIEEIKIGSEIGASKIKTNGGSMISESKDDCFVKPKPIVRLNKQDSVDIFDEVGSPVVKCEITLEKDEETKEQANMEDKLTEAQEHQSETNKIMKLSEGNTNAAKVSISFINRNTVGSNTTEEFENLYRDVSTSNVSDFSALLTHENITNEYVTKDSVSKDSGNASSGNVFANAIKIDRHSNTDTCKDEKQKLETTFDAGETKTKEEDDPNNVKYNLRMRSEKKKEKGAKYNLRLRRQNKLNFEAGSEDSSKLQDIVNLQKQFSDVTLDIPVKEKPTRDMDFLVEDAQEKENFALEVQSCPQKRLAYVFLGSAIVNGNVNGIYVGNEDSLIKSTQELGTGYEVGQRTASRTKQIRTDTGIRIHPEPTREKPRADRLVNVTRSRRKLYTPREPLEDSTVAGESDERVKIPRPSYHRGRARRRL